MRYYLGIDGGGTKSTALLCDENGRCVSSVTGKGINFHTIGMENARAHLRELADAVLQDQNITISSVYIGCAALEAPADDFVTKALCDGIIPCEHVYLDSDVSVALEAMDVHGPAAIAICGTGSMAAAKLTDGTLIHAGGWGYLIGDEGSGCSIALDAIREGVKAMEGTAAPTMLSDEIISFFRLGKPSDLIDHIYGPSSSPADIAAFAPNVFLCAETDATAQHIIEKNAMAFAKTVGVLLDRLPAGSPLGLWGGIFQHQEQFRDLFISLIAKMYPLTPISLLPHPPEYGAVLAAMRTEEHI